jgi:hypothetical protein
MHETALRLFPDSPYAKEHSTEAPTKASKTSAAEKRAIRLMRKLYAATGGPPQRWETLDNLGAVKPMRRPSPTPLKGIGSSFPAACIR